MKSRQLRILAVVTIAVLLSVVTAVAQRANRTEAFDVSKGGQLVVETDNASADIFIRVWDKNQVVVKSPKVPSPTQVRYAWKPFPLPCPNLVNSADLPASPFTTQSAY